MTARLKSFATDTKGATAVEYSLLASLIAVVIATICASMYTALSAEYVGIANAFN